MEQRVGLKSDGTLSRPRICKPLYGLSQDRRRNWRRYRPTTCYMVTLQYI